MNLAQDRCCMMKDLLQENRGQGIATKADLTTDATDALPQVTSFLPISLLAIQSTRCTDHFFSLPSAARHARRGFSITTSLFHKQ